MSGETLGDWYGIAALGFWVVALVLVVGLMWLSSGRRREMPKMTTERVLEIAEPVLAAPRRVRDIIERKLAAKRGEEDKGKALIVPDKAD